MAINEQGHYGKYSGNARCCAHTRVDAHNYKATERDDAAHIVALEEDMKYDKDHHGPAKALVGDQDKLPIHLQQEILDSPGKRYCIK